MEFLSGAPPGVLAVTGSTAPYGDDVVAALCMPPCLPVHDLIAWTWCRQKACTSLHAIWPLSEYGKGCNSECSFCIMCGAG